MGTNSDVALSVPVAMIDVGAVLEVLENVAFGEELSAAVTDSDLDVEDGIYDRLVGEKVIVAELEPIGTTVVSALLVREVFVPEDAAIPEEVAVPEDVIVPEDVKVPDDTAVPENVDELSCVVLEESRVMVVPVERGIDVEVVDPETVTGTAVEPDGPVDVLRV